MSAGRGGYGRRIDFDRNAAFGPHFCCAKTSLITPRTLEEVHSEKSIEQLGAFAAVDAVEDVASYTTLGDCGLLQRMLD